MNALITPIRREEIVQRGPSEGHGMPSTTVHNAVEYPFSSPDISSDSYSGQPSTQHFTYNPIPMHGRNQHDNQSGHSRSVMEHRLHSLSTGIGAHNNPHDDIMRTSHPAHNPQHSSTTQPMSSNGSSARGPATLHTIPDLRYPARGTREESVPQLVTENPAPFVSDHPNVNRQHQQQYSHRNFDTAFEHQDGHPHQQQSNSWGEAGHVPGSSSAVPPERHHAGSLSLFQQGSWQSDTTMSPTAFSLSSRPQVSLTGLHLPR